MMTQNDVKGGGGLTYMPWRAQVPLLCSDLTMGLKEIVGKLKIKKQFQNDFLFLFTTSMNVLSPVLLTMEVRVGEMI